MPNNPVTPAEFKEIIPAANSSICAKLLASLVKFPTLFYKWYSWAFNADGTPSDDFKTAIGVLIGQLTAPGGVTASDGTYTDKVRVNWSPVGGATFYEVWRGPTNDSASATLLSTTTAPVTTYDDSTTSDGTVYWFFVKAKTATDASGFSTGDSGFMDASGGGGAGTTTPVIFTGNGTWTVPAGVATISVEAWGAGGGGGAGNCTYCYTTDPFYAGGGGGSGEYMKVTGITAVSPGDVLTILVDQGGAKGEIDGAGFNDAGNGGSSVVNGPTGNLVTTAGGKKGTSGRTGSENGAGGAGGAGGSATSGVVAVQTSGTVGGDGTSGILAAPGTPGAGGAANTGGGNAGGNGGWRANGTKGQGGKIIITPAP